MRFGLNQDRKLVHFFLQGGCRPSPDCCCCRALCDIVGGKDMQRAANKSAVFSGVGANKNIPIIQRVT